MEAVANFAAQITPVVCLTGDLSVTLPAFNVREDLSSRLDDAQGHDLSIVNGCSDMAGPIGFDQI
jgi:hypothetical protein